MHIKSNQITFIVTSPQHKCLVSEILTSVLQTVQKKKKIYIWTVHIYRLYRRQCAKYTYIYSVHTVYYKDILSYQYTLYTACTHSTLCTHLYIVISEGATDYTFTADVFAFIIFTFFLCILLYSTHLQYCTHI